MDLRSEIESEVFDSKVLDDQLALFVLLIDRLLRVDHTEDAIVFLRNNEGRDAGDPKVEVVNDIALRVEEHLSGEELRFESSTDPGDEMLVAVTKPVKELVLLEILPVDFFADFQFEMHR